MSNVVIYARFSSSKQREESIEGQIRVCKDFAKNHDMTVIQEYCDRAQTGLSFEKRNGALKLMKDAENKNFTAVLVYKFDRFSRDPADFYSYKKGLEKNGVKLISVTEPVGENAEGELIMGVHTAYNSFYSKELAAKVSLGMEENAKKGKYNGGSRPFGYDIKGHKFSINHNESVIVKQLFDMYADGKSNKEIIEFCNKLGCKTPRGKEFTHDFLTRVLKNRKYIGDFTWKTTEKQQDDLKIVDERIFDKVQKRLKENGYAGARANAKEPYALIGKIFCGYCGEPMVADCVKKNIKINHSKYFSAQTLNTIITAVEESEDTEDTNCEIENGVKIYRYYTCRGRKNPKFKNGCKKERVNKDEIENAVINFTVKQYLSNKNIDRLVKATIELQEKMRSKESDKAYKEKIKEETEKMENLYDMVEKGYGTERLYKRITQAENRKSELEKELEEYRRLNLEMTEKDIREKLVRVREIMNQYISNGKIPIEVRKTFCNIFITAVYVFDEDEDGGRRIKIVFDEFETDGLEGFDEADIKFSSTLNKNCSP